MGMGGIGSSETNKVDQFTVLGQATTQTGSAFGATVNRGAGGSFGTGATGNISGGLRITGHGSGNTTVNITSPEAFDVANHAIDATHSAALATLEANQSLSTQAIGFANANAMEAFDVLRQLGTQAQVQSAGGSAGDILNAQGNALTGTASTTINNKVIYGALAVVAAIAVLAYIYKRHY